MEGVRDVLKNEMASLQGAVDEAKAMGERGTPCGRHKRGSARAQAARCCGFR